MTPVELCALADRLVAAVAAAVVMGPVPRAEGSAGTAAGTPAGYE